MKSLIAALLLTTAAPGLSAVPEVIDIAAEEAPVAADPSKAMMDSIMSMFGNIFDTSKLPPPEPERLKLAEVTASRLLPDGAYAKMVNDMISNIAMPMLNAMPGLTDAQITAKTGASSEAVEALSAESKEAVTLIIDPNYRKRGEQLMSIMTPVINDLMAELEPAMRVGLSRAYARKFSAAELNGINSFFATPTGASYARESFALQADPEVLQAMFKAIPAMVGKVTGDEKALKAKFDALPKERKLSEMSDAELKKLATLLGVTVQSLKDYKENDMAWAVGLPECAQDGDESDCTDADWSAVGAAEAAEAAAKAAADEAALVEADKKMRSAWSKADLKAVEEAEAAQAAAWERHSKVDEEVSEAGLALQAAIDTAKRNAGQPVEEDHHHDGMKAADSMT